MSGRLTVLAWEGPQARAYLVRMARARLRPERILLMVGGPLRRRGAAKLTRGMWVRYAERIQERTHNYHVYQIRNKHPDLVRAIAAGMATHVDDPTALHAEMYDGFSYDRFADDVVRIPASSYKAPEVMAALKAASGTVLFTGGGIVPPEVFAIPGIRMIHVHTGFLPYVRGADVLLWSLLVRGRPGVSAFLMTPGLDEGDVLAARELDPIRVVLPQGPRIDDDTLYRAVFSFIDPLIRAEFLVTQVLEPFGHLPAWPSVPQDPGQGTMYHFMHREVRHRALQVLFASPAPCLRVAPPPLTRNGSSPERYARYYDHHSLGARPRFAFDAWRAPTRLRALSLRNRRKDYAALARSPRRMELHAEFNRQLALQAAHWTSYDYGEGWFYQSSEELGITGLRDTARRVEAFGLSDLVRGRSVLDVGCNSGFLSLAIAPSAAHIVAFDLNPYLVAMARAAQQFLEVKNVDFSVSAFEDFAACRRFDDVLSFANHHTYDGNTRQSLDEYFVRCHALTKPGGRLIFESHPPELEGDAFGRTLTALERYFAIERCEVHDYGTFLDKGRRFLVAVRRECARDVKIL